METELAVSLLICAAWWLVGFCSHWAVTLIKKSPEEKALIKYTKQQKKIESNWKMKGNGTLFAAIIIFLLGIFICLVLLGYIHLPRIGIYFW